MADILSIKRSTYANWESSVEPDMDTIRTIADKLNIPIETLLSTPVPQYDYKEMYYQQLAENNKLLKERDTLYVKKDVHLRIEKAQRIRILALQNFLLTLAAEIRDKPYHSQLEALDTIENGLRGKSPDKDIYHDSGMSHKLIEAADL